MYFRFLYFISSETGYEVYSILDLGYIWCIVDIIERYNNKIKLPWLQYFDIKTRNLNEAQKKMIHQQNWKLDKVDPVEPFKVPD